MMTRNNLLRRSAVAALALFSCLWAGMSEISYLGGFWLCAQRYVGGDLSMLPAYEAANTTYRTPQGQRIDDLIDYVKTEAGFNIVRVRLFVNPTKETGVVQDLDYVKALGSRIKQKGMALMLDFHYSDTWADPSSQWTPAAWASLTDDQLYQKIYDYTRECLQEMKAAGATPDFIQTGNEISYGMLWGTKNGAQKKCYTSSEANWERFRQLLTQAGKACREECPDAKIIIHTERTNAWSTTKGIYDRLSTIDYDVIGLSYYPEWHNNISTLVATLRSCHNNWPDKQLMIVETGYANNWYNSQATYNFESTWAASAAGQNAFIKDLVAGLEGLDYVTGLLYWFPEENPYGNHVYEPWFNHGLFNPNNGRATDGLFSLRSFRGNSTGIERSTFDHSSLNIEHSSAIYDLQGRSIGSMFNSQSTMVNNQWSMINNQRPRGIFIADGKKIMIGR